MKTSSQYLFVVKGSFTFPASPFFSQSFLPWGGEVDSGTSLELGLVEVDSSSSFQGLPFPFSRCLSRLDNAIHRWACVPTSGARVSTGVLLKRCEMPSKF